MAKKQSGKRGRHVPKTVLRLPDLDQAKSAVLNSLSSVDAQRDTVDLKGKAGQTRTIPMPGWVKCLLDEWLLAANLTTGKLPICPKLAGH